MVIIVSGSLVASILFSCRLVFSSKNYIFFDSVSPSANACFKIDLSKEQDIVLRSVIKNVYF